ncbi:MAG: N-acetylmuramoyl-L-alanine amidase [Myxococcales bacterium]
MSSAVLALACLALGRLTPDQAAYERARQSFYALKADAARRKDRSHWLNAAARFEAVADRYPASPKAAQALYTAAELRNELSQISFVAADRELALEDYRRVAKGHPKSELADDALYQAARIELDHQDDAGAARDDLERLLELYPRGDMTRRAKAMLASLGPPPKKRNRKASASPDSPAQPSAAKRGRVSASPRPPASDHEPEHAAIEAPPPRPAVERAVPAADAGVELHALRQAGAAPGGIPLAVQMGLAVRRVVIDAGHGGHDSGAIGPGGTREKDVTLAIALKLAEDLRAKGLEVLLTRDGDRFVSLEERARFANEHKADLFVSLHANANTDRRQRGVETYFLNVTSDRYAIRLAARENQASERSVSDLQLILADLATKSNVEESHQLADRVQRSLVDGLAGKQQRERNLGVKHALFYVLLGVKMPAILVESAFVSNPAEEKRLASGLFQDEVARDVAAGIEKFVRDRRELAGL